MNQIHYKQEIFHVFQIALSVAMSVFLIALYVRPVPVLGSGRVREVRTQQTFYLMDVKYLTADGKPIFLQMLPDKKLML